MLLEDVGVEVCEPWPETGRAECGPFEAHFAGTPGCELVAPCPPGDFPDDLPIDREAIFIAGTPGSGGYGTRAQPFHDLADAFRAASGTEIFVLGKGTHRIDAAFPDDVTFWGACPSETHLVAGFTDPSTGTVTAVEQGRLEIRNVHVQGPTPGFRALEMATIVAENVVIDGTGIAAVWIEDGSAFVGTRIVVRDTTGEAGEFGRAFSAALGSRIEIHGAVVERVREIAAYASDPGSALVLHDVVIADTLPQESDQGWGRGVEVNTGATAELVRVVIENNRDYGVFAGEASSSLRIEHSIVRGTRSRADDGEAGRGISAQMGARVDATRVLVDDNRELGMYAAGAGGVTTLRDVVVRGTQAREIDQVGGRGIQVQWGAHLDAERVIVARSQEHGVLAFEGSARLADVVIRDTAPSPAGGMGRGLEAFGVSTIELSRVAIERNVDTGARIADVGTTVTLADVVIAGTLPRAGTVEWGRGLSVHDAIVTGERVRILDNAEAGVDLQGGELSLTDVHVERTASRACGDACASGRLGVGFLSAGAARARLVDFVIADNALAGLIVAMDSMVALERGEISGHPIGVFVDDTIIDFERGFSDVTFVENERNLDAQVLPLPDPTPPGATRF